MKRHTQETGVRFWSGDDLCELQSETLNILDNFFKQLGNLIISGCEISGSNISAGIVGLAGKDANNNTVYKIAPFAGKTGVTFPAYLFLKCTQETREYADGNEKPVKEIYTAELSATIPNGTDYLTINASGNRIFTDAIQDSNHQFITVTQKTKLNGIAEGANNYTHPTHTEKTSGLYKITVDKSGHVTATTSATKSDVGLGNVENVAALPLTGGSLTGKLTAPGIISNTTTASTSRKILGTDGGYYEVCEPSWEQDYLNKIPIINNGGVMWVGQEIKFNIPGSQANYDTRIYYNTSDGMMYYTNALSYFSSGLFNLKAYNGLEVRYYRAGSGYLRLMPSNITAFSDEGNTLDTLTINRSVDIDALGNIKTSGSITGNTASDRKFKKSIRNINSALKTVLKLRPVSFKWNNKIKEMDASRNHDKTVFGFIAQEVEEVIPEAVGNIYTEEFKALDPLQFIPILTAAIQEQQQTIEELKKRVTNLEK